MKKKQKTETVTPEDEEKVLSLKRLGIFFIICSVVVTGTYFSLKYLFKYLLEKVSNLSESSNSNIPDHVRLPNPEDINKLINFLKDNLQNYLIHDLGILVKLFDYLRDMQLSGLGLEDIVCNYIC